MKKHSVNILGHETSITLEDEFWSALKKEAAHRGLSLNKLIAEIDEARTPETNLSSAIRLYILNKLQERLS
ncbi:MAG: aryl-sulfate sulfotransferase [Micavibrio sp.]|nr:aryl-sulfate sulfotransferase [Micavibrio sp.]|tara:strand:- start:570 stop:782 length:213 start_codon:yes stop_codon:yes gene_type:complete